MVAKNITLQPQQVPITTTNMEDNLCVKFFGKVEGWRWKVKEREGFKKNQDNI